MTVGYYWHFTVYLPAGKRRTSLGNFCFKLTILRKKIINPELRKRSPSRTACVSRVNPDLANLCFSLFSIEEHWICLIVYAKAQSGVNYILLSYAKKCAKVIV